MRSLGYMPSEVELAIIMQRLDMDGEFQSSAFLNPLLVSFLDFASLKSLSLYSFLCISQYPLSALIL